MSTSYVIDQYNEFRSSYSSSNDPYMTLLTIGTAARKKYQGDEQVSYSSIFTEIEDECIRFPTSLDTSTTYYFHGKIKRLTTAQSFNIKLCYYNSDDDENKKVTQFIKNITVGSGDLTQWVDVEFMFTPLQSFDCIVFELERTVSDFSTYGRRFPLIAYEELSVVNNILTIPQKIASDKLIKLGVQSRPGLLMCINREEIRVGQSGIYEIKNGVITVYFFSVVNSVDEANTAMAEWMVEAGAEAGESGSENIPSRSFFAEPKQDRVIDGYTLDYMYRLKS